MISVDDDVVWHSPFTDEDVIVNFRGYEGDKAVLFNKKSGFQVQVPKEQIKPLLDKTPESGIMTSGGNEDGSDIHGKTLRRAEQGEPDGHGDDIREGQSPRGISKTGSGEEAGQALRSEGNQDEGIRSESNNERVVGRGSVESGDTPDNSGNRVGLESPTGQIKTDVPKDIVLDSNSDIGYNAGAAGRFDANLAALRLLKTLDTEQRKANPSEQAVLTKYSGFGDSAFEQAFKPGMRDTAWTKRGEELKSLTTQDEYEAIESSRINAFYTTPEVINAMWAGLERLGIDKLARPRILEPSAGSGRFLGYEPKELAARSERTAVEKDVMTGKILKHLYPDTAVYGGVGYEDAPIRKGSIDVAISNVPFGDVAVFDKEFRHSKRKLTRQIHNYFFAKSLDHLRPGGIIAFITSHNTLDAVKAKPIREELASQANFLGAIRLPKGAFPDTEVVTDIIYMQKRLPTEAPGDNSWVDTGEFTQIEKKTYGGMGRNRGMEHSYDVTHKANVNKYFLDHPEMVLGKNAFTGSQYGADEYSVEMTPGSLSEKLSQAITKLPDNVIQESTVDLGPRFVNTPTAGNARVGTRTVGEDGRVYKTTAYGLENADLNTEGIERVKGMLEVRDAAKTVLQSELDERDDITLTDAQKKLNTVYDEYVLKYGALNDPRNTDVMKDDPDAPFLKALENSKILRQKKDLTEKDLDLVGLLKGKTKITQSKLDDLKADLFKGRTIHGYGDKPVSTDVDAMSFVKNQMGWLNFPRMASLLGQNEDEVKASLAKKGLIFNNPAGGWESSEEYLTGDVREKLRVAQNAATANPMFEDNVEVLKTIQPKDLEPSQISAPMGVPWIPASDINEFVSDILRTSKNNGKDDFFEYNKIAGTWEAGDEKPKPRSFDAQNDYGTDRMPAWRVIEHVLNGQVVQVFDHHEEDGKDVAVRNDVETINAQEKAKAVSKAFDDWVWKDPERTERLVKYYNNTFNNFRPRIFNGQHVELPGMTKVWVDKTHPHVKDAIWRIVQDRTALLAHEVGFGKTAVMVGSGMELRRLGLAQKVMYVVPKTTHPQFRNQVLEMYPYAKVLFPEANDFSDQNRREFTSRAATGDWDAVILTYEQFSKLPVRPATEAKFLKEEIADLREAIEEEEAMGHGVPEKQTGYGRQKKSEESRTHKQLQKALDKAKERLQERMAKINDKSDNTIYFEDIGVDQLYVDEAHNFKNLPYVSRMGNIKGLPRSQSQRAWDMYEKSRVMQSEGKSKGIVFATGTPISNTIAEAYTMMRYLQQPMLEAKGIKHFDAWAKTFGETEESLEVSPQGTYKMVQRFKRFRNAPELNGMWQQVADIRIADEVPEMVKRRPRIVDEQGKAKRTVVACPSDDALKQYMKELALRAESLKGPPKKGGDNMLKISSDARKASIDVRMVRATAPVNPSNKVAIAAKKIAEIYKESDADKGTQFVFLDMGIPKADDEKAKETDTEGNVDDNYTEEEQKVVTNIYGNIKAELVARGIPENEIKFIQEAKDNEAKLKIVDQVNKGQIRVIIGSTAKLGTGINAQDRAVAVHHIDSPWKPADIEQREGRAIRQGNFVAGPKLDKKGNVLDPGKGVKVFQYVTENSFDEFMWQAVEAKAKGVKQLMRRNCVVRDLEDVDNLSLSASEAKAWASGNPDNIKLMTLRNSLGRLNLLKSSHIDTRAKAQEQLIGLPKQIAERKTNITESEKDLELVNKERDFHLQLENRKYSERPAAAERLIELTKNSKSWTKIGEYKGFNVQVVDEGPQSGYKYVLQAPGRSAHTSSLISYAELTPQGAMARLENVVNRGVEARLQRDKAALVESEDKLKAYKGIEVKPFVYQDQLERVEKDINLLERKLQGQKIDEEVSGNYVAPDVEDEPQYRYGEESTELAINPKESMVVTAEAITSVDNVLSEPKVKEIESLIDKVDDIKPEPVELPEVISIDNKPEDLPEIVNKPDTTKEQNTVFGALNDERSNTAIAKDIEVKNSPVGKQGTDLVTHDLPGWDTHELADYQEEYEKVFPGIKSKLEGAIPDAEFSGRVKTLESIVKKLKKKNQSGKPFTEQNMEDIIGVRLTVDNDKDIFHAAEKIKGSFKVTQDEDYITNLRPDGYRSYHLTIEYEGKPVEVQIRTKNQTAWADWTHETFYDHPYETKEKLGDDYEKAQAYSVALGDYFDKLDKGLDAKEPEPLVSHPDFHPKMPESPRQAELRIKRNEAIEVEIAKDKESSHTAIVERADATIKRTYGVGIYGNETEAFGANPSETEQTYKFRYKVVDMDDLIASHTDTLELNSKYPQELQPRLRDRAASRTQIENIAKNLNPRALLQDSGFIDTGPMIVGPDDVVESGNGRVLALRKAEKEYPVQYARYKAMLEVTAKSLGIDKEQLATIKNPVLVRERLTNVDRAKFAAEANVGAVMGMSPYEHALQDSGRLSPHVVSNLAVGEEQTIDQALRMKGNNDIIKHFVDNIPTTERATIADEKGNINQQGLDRLKLAIFAKTYTGDAGKRLVRIFGESADPQVKSIENAMFASLPDMAKATGLIDSKQREANLDIAPDMAEVVDTYAALKARGLSIPDYLKQQAMFEERLTPFQKQLLQHLDDTARKPKLVREMLRDTAQRIIDAPAKGQTGFMGIEPVTKEELVYGVINKQRAELGEPAFTYTAAVSASKELEKADTSGDKSPGRLEPRLESGRGETGQMASGASVQTGLGGFGKETAQVEMFGESNTAAGQGGKKDTLVDVEKEKAKEITKPLLGQIELKEKPTAKEPWQMTAEEFHDSRQKGPFALDWMEVKFLHSEAVKQAISEGKPVPPEVMKDYPDLVRVGSGESEVKEGPKLNRYYGFYKNKRDEVLADTKYHAQVELAKKMHAKETYKVAVQLVETGVNQNDTEKKGIETPYELGKEAFKRGAKRVPYHDKDFTGNYYRTGQEVGAGIEFSAEWLKGWDDANLKMHNPSGFEDVKPDVIITTPFTTKDDIPGITRVSETETRDSHKVEKGGSTPPPATKKERSPRTKKATEVQGDVSDPRSKIAIATDNALLAKTVTKDVDEWKGNRSGIDLKGIDTPIPLFFRGRHSPIAIKRGDSWLVLYPPFNDSARRIHTESPPASAIKVSTMARAYKVIKQAGGDPGVLVAKQEVKAQSETKKVNKKRQKIEKRAKTKQPRALMMRRK